MPLFRAQHTCAAFALAIAVQLHAAPAQHSTSAAARQLSAAAAAAAVTSGPQQRSTSMPAAACLSNTEMSGNEQGRPERLGGIGDSSRISLEADASARLGDLALSADTAMDNASANSRAGDLGGICGGCNRSEVCSCVFLVSGSARGVARRAFPAMLQAARARADTCQFSLIFTGRRGR